jgi:phosphomevalonate kinase
LGLFKPVVRSPGFQGKEADVFSLLPSKGINRLKMPTAVSAPGKVFLAGGYLVLDRAYTALVFGLSARVHVLVHDIDTSSGVELSEIVVQSPQFRDATWNYGYRLTEEHGGVEVTQLQG